MNSRAREKKEKEEKRRKTNMIVIGVFVVGLLVCFLVWRSWTDTKFLPRMLKVDENEYAREVGV